MELLGQQYFDYGKPINSVIDPIKILVPQRAIVGFASGYAVLAIAVVLLGTKGFDKVENLISNHKISGDCDVYYHRSMCRFRMDKGTGSSPKLPTEMGHIFQKRLQRLLGISSSMRFMLTAASKSSV